MRLELKPCPYIGLIQALPFVLVWLMWSWFWPWLPLVWAWAGMIGLVLGAVFGWLDGMKALPWSIVAIEQNHDQLIVQRRAAEDHERVPAALASNGWIGERFCLIGLRGRFGFTQPCWITEHNTAAEPRRQFRQALLWDAGIWRRSIGRR